MKIIAYKCKKCNTAIFSRAKWDFRWCPCESIFVDGGFEHLRMGVKGKDLKILERLEIDLNVTKEELYNVWNKKQDKFGLIKLDS
jgi:hypothetical protein